MPINPSLAEPAPCPWPDKAQPNPNGRSPGLLMLFLTKPSLLVSSVLLRLQQPILSYPSGPPPRALLSPPNCLFSSATATRLYSHPFHLPTLSQSFCKSLATPPLASASLFLGASVAVHIRYFAVFSLYLPPSLHPQVSRDPNGCKSPSRKYAPKELPDSRHLNAARPTSTRFT